ncbi:MAG: alpha/beta fold hydrolase [Verrucomicrobiae bacterium]|nr:alpha/beta fold hydrolase [Verrucomicrobiae bacterium]
MKFLVRTALHCRHWTRLTLRRVIILAALFLLGCGAIFGIGQLQANQTMSPVCAFSSHGNRTGVLLLHGFGGSPFEVQPIAQGLAENGCTVDAPLLPGHGTTPRDFAATTNDQYLSAARRELQTLHQTCDRIYVVGFSMGGLIALQLQEESKIDGLVLMSTPIQPWNDFAQFDWLKAAAERGSRIHLFVPTLGIPTLVKATRREFGDMPSNLIEPSYAAYPMASCLRLLEMIEDVKPGLPTVTTPTLILHSLDDHVSAPSSAEYLYDHLGSTQKRLVYLKNSGHVIALGRERDEVARLVEGFVETGSVR